MKIEIRPGPLGAEGGEPFREVREVAHDLVVEAAGIEPAARRRTYTALLRVLRHMACIQRVSRYRCASTGQDAFSDQGVPVSPSAHVHTCTPSLLGG